MFFLFNLTAIALVGAAVVVDLVLSLLPSINPGTAAAVSCLGVVAGDLAVRIRNPSQSPHPIVSPEVGGYVFFLPCWVWGICGAFLFFFARDLMG